jgi:hypothetical protein
MKKLYILLLVAAGLLIAAYLFVRFFLQADIRDSKNRAGDSAGSHLRNPDSTLDLRPLFIAKIQQLVNQGSKGLYNISIDSMEVDLLQSRVVLQRVKLLHDSKMLALLHIAEEAPDDVFTASFDTLVINGINLDDVLTRKTIDLKEIQISGPIIEVFHTDRPYNRSKKPDSISVFDRIMKDMNRIAIGKVIIHKGTIISNDQRKNKKNKWSDVEMSFSDILIDSSTEHSRDRFLFAREASISIKNYSLKTKDDLYLVTIGTLAIQAPQQTMTIRDFSLASRYNKKEFQRKLVRQKEQYEVKAPKITIKDIDWWALMNEDRFLAGALIVSDAVIKIHLDRSLPRPESKMGNFPHQLIAKLPIEVSASSVAIRNADLTYEEYNPRSAQTGSIHLNQVNLDISSITNIRRQMRNKKQTIVAGTARLKDIPVKARFAFDLMNYKTGKFSANLSTGGFEGNIMNDVAESLGLMKIEKGTVKEFKVTMQGDERQATGKVLILYNDLKVSIYEKEKDEKGLDKKGVIGFLANTFVIKDDNPAKNKPYRNPSASFQRDPQTGFFNLVWKTALNGILKTIGANPKLGAKK